MILNICSAAQLNEALQMQKEVHIRMSDRLEVFKKSQLCSIRTSKQELIKIKEKGVGWVNKPFVSMYVN